MIKDLFSWIPAIAYLLVIGEGMALLFGLVIAKNQSAWNTRKNHTLLITDLVLAWSAFLNLLMEYTGMIILIFTILLMLSHAYRIIEHYTEVKIPFCFNQALSIINLVKFIGLAFSIYIFI